MGRGLMSVSLPDAMDHLSLAPLQMNWSHGRAVKALVARRASLFVKARYDWSRDFETRAHIVYERR